VLSLKQLAETTAASKQYVSGGPNLNVIAQLSAQEFLAAKGDRHALALTTTTVVEGTGEIIDADTVFNAGLGPFAVCPDDGCPEGSVDIENVATHEFGHFLGLAHSDDDEATMACRANRDELKKRSLDADDEAGICSIYAEPAIEERDEALHARSVHTGCGCRIDDTRGTANAPLGFVGLAALLTLRRRGQASSRRRQR
jgi:MYXO-CTERM domain-containing protein